MLSYKAICNVNALYTVYLAVNICSWMTDELSAFFVGFFVYYVDVSVYEYM